MSDEINTEDQVSEADQLAILKSRARLMGITFSPNIGVAALKAKIEDKLAEGEKKPEPAEVNPLGDAPIDPDVPETPIQIRKRLQKEAMKLVRCRITNLDPKKKDLPGEIITVANEYLGTVRKFVPFGEQTDDGYHLPYCLYKFLLGRKFLNIRILKAPNGTPVVKHEYVREFAIEVLPPLTQQELDKLAAAQAAAGLFSTADQP